MDNISRTGAAQAILKTFAFAKASSEDQAELIFSIARVPKAKGITRCKNCELFRHYENDGKTEFFCLAPDAGGMTRPHPEGFCSDAVAKDTKKESKEG